LPSASDVAQILSAAQSDVGRTRSENQDAFGEFSTPSGERLFVVADGMGGHRGGATASRLCVETVGRVFAEGSDPAEVRLRRGFELANARIHEAAGANSELVGMGTTVVALALASDGSGELGWVGDSRAYRFSDGALELLSTDHSVVGEMVRAGVLPPEEAESHPRRNELLRAIGPRDSVESETLALRHKPGDRFLLCTDGLWGPVPEAEIAVVLGYEAPELAVKKLIAKANERGGPDNVTAQIASIAEPAAELQIARPVAVSSVVTAPRSRSLPLLAAGAAAATAALIALAVYGLGREDPAEAVAVAASQISEERGLDSPPEPAAAPAAVVAAAPGPAATAASVVPAPKAVPERAAAPKQAAPAPKPSSSPVKKPAPAKVAATKPTAVPATKAAAAAPSETAPPVVAAVAPAPLVTAEVAAPDPLAGSLSRLAVEQFLADWEAAISSKDFALYSRLGLPGDAQSFQSHYVDNGAKIDFALHSFEQTDPDQLLVRVQMVLETQDRTGAQRVDEERRFIVKQTPSGLRYVGAPKK